MTHYQTHKGNPMIQHYTCNITYKGYDTEFDFRLRKLAEQYEGKDVGSGSWYPEAQRDIDFYFRNKRKMFKFLVKCRNLNRIISAKHLKEN